ncbi:uncharacterized protein ARMOST_17645 [Armillaria ostoyae]|uniref:Uncharacterized protein n=1 Tax=Armillaria ostoyae TaxID=47428 RepID=A0A284RZN3_ARMOS|nr:uncharacterized protein ARMOST_17645 [Armillaria ostoyae]
MVNTRYVWFPFPKSRTDQVAAFKNTLTLLSGPTAVLQSERQSSPLSSASDTTRASNNPSNEDLNTVEDDKDQTPGHAAGDPVHEDEKSPYDGILNTLIPVPRVRDLLKTNDISDAVPTFDILRRYRNNKEVIKRVLLLAFVPSKSNLVNLALADPSEFSVVSERLVHGLPYPQSFFLIGSVVYSNLFGKDTTKQICMEPLDLSFPHVAAVLGRVFGTAPGGALLFNGYRGGMSFQSWMKSDTIRAWDEPVPVFDCRAGFRLSQYHLNAKCHADPDEGDVVLIICTVGRYRNLSYNVMSLNVQVVLKIANGPTVKDRDKPARPLPYWFYELRSFGVSGEEPAAVVDEGEVEYDPEEVVY